MILYFTGTGNSRYIARKLAAVLGDELLSINEKLKTGDTRPVHADNRFIFVLPTYGWRIPRIVEQWIQQTDFSGGDSAWFMMDCGSEIGNAEKYIQKLCQLKKFVYKGTAQIVMPENYVAMFPVPNKTEAAEIVAKAEPSILAAAEKIAAGQNFPAPRNNLYDRFMSAAVNPLFYAFCVKADAFAAKENCVGCGKCVQFCPLNNITLQNGKPVWGKNCTHCMACICGCPAEAIEYGKKSVGKSRYFCE